MKNASDSARRAREAVVTDLSVIVGDADKLLKDMGSLTSEELMVARQSIEAKLDEPRTRIYDARIVVTRNPHYWDAAHNRLQSVVFLPTEDLAAEERSFRTGQLHITYDLPPAKLAAYRADPAGPLRIDPRVLSIGRSTGGPP